LNLFPCCLYASELKAVLEYRQRLIDFLTAPALGMSYGGRIAILPGPLQPKSSAPLSMNSHTKCSTNMVLEPPYGV
jgi:hypothetical protein